MNQLHSVLIAATRQTDAIHKFGYIFITTCEMSCICCRCEFKIFKLMFSWPVVFHPTIESCVFQCHPYMGADLFLLQHGVIWVFPLPSSRTAKMQYGSFARVKSLF